MLPYRALPNLVEAQVFVKRRVRFILLYPLLELFWGWVKYYFKCGASGLIRTSSVSEEIQIYSLTRPTVFASLAYLAESRGVDPPSFRSHGFQARSQSRLRYSLNWRKRSESNTLMAQHHVLLFEGSYHH